jgi:hypothetical protein
MPAQGQRGGDGLDGDRVLVGEIGDRARYVEDLAAPAGRQGTAVVRTVERCLGGGAEKQCSPARGDRRCRQGGVRRVSVLEGAALARGEDARAQLGRRGGRSGTLAVDGGRKVDDDRKPIKRGPDSRRWYRASVPASQAHPPVLPWPHGHGGAEATS